jgi:diguanylate cyclase
MPIRTRASHASRYGRPFGVFVLAGTVLIVLAGVAIGWLCGRVLQVQATGDARATASQIAAGAEHGPSGARPPADPDQAAVVIADSAGRILYPGRSRHDPALAGQVVTAVAKKGATGEIVRPSARSGRTLNFYFWLAQRPGKPRRAVRVSLPYEPIAAQVRTQTRRLDLLIGGVMLLLSAALGAIAAHASRRARKDLARSEESGGRDPLTGLPNREQLQDLVHRAIGSSGRSGDRVALMLMDLNGFKEINDTLGHHNGDRVLQQLASRLRSVLRDSETVARLGGDEFAILVPGFSDQNEVVAVAERIVRALEEPFVTAGLALELGASIGIALFPDHGDRVAQLLRAADVAMYEGKESLAGYTIFNPASDRGDDGGKRLTLIGELRGALERRELILYYQPKVELPGGRVTGVEALVRWQHHRGGLLTPDEFVPLLEQSSLLRQVTLYLVEMALHDCGSWRARGHPVSVAVNLSMRNLLDSQLPAELSFLVRKTGLTPDCLELEITESMLMSDPERIMRVCTSLRRHGFRLTVDDFGTGYSSLAYLQRLPVSALKVDKSFVTAMDSGDPDSATIVRSTVDLAHNLGLTVIAEGVESEAMYNQLASLKCDVAQGFFVSRPMPHEQLIEWLGRFGGQDIPSSMRAVHEDLLAR